MCIRDSCDAFDIPVLTLTNATGFMATLCSEKMMAKSVGELVAAFADATVPKAVSYTHLSRSNLVSGLRNLILSIIAPFPPLSGPLWVGMTVSVSMRYKEGKKAMKSLLGGMASFRLATFLSVLIIPVVSFFRPIFGVGSSITLMFQAFVCARIGMDYCKSDRDKMIAGVMAAVLATQGTAWASAWALAVGDVYKRQIFYVQAFTVL